MVELPSVDTHLCFAPESLLKPEFDLDRFVASCRQHTSLDKIRSDLSLYMNVLQNRLIEVINDDYADFVKLSTDLVGLSKSIDQLETPVDDLFDASSAISLLVSTKVNYFKQKLLQKQHNLLEKRRLTRTIALIRLIKSTELSLEELHNTDIQSSTSFKKIVVDLCRLKHLIDPLQSAEDSNSNVLKLIPRVKRIQSEVSGIIESQFISAYNNCDESALFNALDMAMSLSLESLLEERFRKRIVRPYMETVISEDILLKGEHALSDMYKRILDFLDTSQCSLLIRITKPHSGNNVGLAEDLSCFNFMSNAIWPEISYCMETRTPSAFAPGNPSAFHKKYETSLHFLNNLELFCGTQAAVKQFRSHSSYTAFMAKWNLPVYYQLRYQEIATDFERALERDQMLKEKSDDSHSKFLQLTVTAGLWRNLNRCWQSDVYLAPLCHRFWKLSFQLLHRYAAFLVTLFDNEKASDAANITLIERAKLIYESELIVSKLDDWFDRSPWPCISAFKPREYSRYKDCVRLSGNTILVALSRVEESIVRELTEQCAGLLKSVQDIPRLYRKTNREVQNKSSPYMASILTILRQFNEESPLPAERWNKCLVRILVSLTETYHGLSLDLLTSVKRMEDSLKRLKKGKGGTSSSSLATGVGQLSDDDKIRTQLAIDIQCFGDMVMKLNANPGDIQKLPDLLKLTAAIRTETDE